MRSRAWLAIVLFVVGLTVGIAGRQLPNPQAWNLVAGLLFLAAVLVWATALSLWRRLVPNPMPGLFARPGPNERSCSYCGHLTPRTGPCRTCGANVRSTGK